MAEYDDKRKIDAGSSNLVYLISRDNVSEHNIGSPVLINETGKKQWINQQFGEEAERRDELLNEENDREKERSVSEGKDE